MMIVFQRNKKLFIVHCRYAESEVQQTLKHHLLCCEHLVLIFDLAEPVLICVRLVDERPLGVVELFHVFGSFSFTDVAAWCSEN